MKTWEGRAEPAQHAGWVALFEAFTESTANDRRLARYDVRASQAHARALQAADLIDEDAARRLLTALGEIAHEMQTGSFVWRAELEDVHTHVEVRLRELVGALADTLHTGRSRNDQIATDLRLFVKDATLDVVLAGIRLADALLDRARAYAGAIMPGYTHLQRGQPVTIAHYLLAYVEMLARDRGRYDDALDRADRCPLGSGALAGAGFALDRDFMARDLGFAAPTTNSMDSVADRDFLVEFLAASAQLMVHLSRLAEDFILWSTSEFAFVALPAELTSGSSMMPQKRNPDVLELIRGRAARVIGALTAALSLTKGLPLTYNRDLQEATSLLLDTVDAVHGSLEILTPLIAGSTFDTARTSAVAGGSSLATDLADALVRAGVPFREAHRRVARMLMRLQHEGRDLSDLTSAELHTLQPESSRAASVPIFPADVLRPAASVRQRATYGSTNPAMVAEAMRAAGHELETARRTWEARADLLRTVLAT